MQVPTWRMTGIRTIPCWFRSTGKQSILVVTSFSVRNKVGANDVQFAVLANLVYLSTSVKIAPSRKHPLRCDARYRIVTTGTLSKFAGSTSSEGPPASINKLPSALDLDTLAITSILVTSVRKSARAPSHNDPDVPTRILEVASQTGPDFLTVTSASVSKDAGSLQRLSSCRCHQ